LNHLASFLFQKAQKHDVFPEYLFNREEGACLYPIISQLEWIASDKPCFVRLLNPVIPKIGAS
jgi:hypothetical protein